MKRLSLAMCLTAFAAPVVAEDADRGRDTYERFCASCHGVEATGMGPMQPVLMVTPTDLTRLSAENDGEFPLVRVIKRIDGRDPLVSHGSQMPVYGDYFEGNDTSMQAPSGQPIMTSQPVKELVAYLKTLQR